MAAISERRWIDRRRFKRECTSRSVPVVISAPELGKNDWQWEFVLLVDCTMTDNRGETSNTIETILASNAKTTEALYALVTRLDEQHGDLEEQHRDNQSISHKMMWATVVMTMATVAMAWDAISR